MDSNHGPLELHSSALTTELYPLIIYFDVLNNLVGYQPYSYIPDDISTGITKQPPTHGYISDIRYQAPRFR